MSRLYASARKVLEEAGHDPDTVEIEGTGKGGAVTKGDAEAFLANAASPEPADGKPTQADLIRQGLVEGLDNAAILEQVRQVHPDTKMKTGDVSVLIWEERNRDSDWWKANWETVVSHRRVRGREEA